MTGDIRKQAVGYLQRHGEVDAERAADEAEAFLRAAADSPTPLRPSPIADVGWHAFLLHTREYAAFCDREFGRFIHHIPGDGSCGGQGCTGGDCSSGR